jgi:hypothetical protein
MNLQESIIRILREEKDHIKLIKGIIDSSDIFDYKHFCGVDIITPEEISDQYKLLNKDRTPYLIKVYFVGGPNSEVWPITQAIRSKESDLMGELQEYIKSFVPFNIEMMGSHVNSCDGYKKLMKRKYTTDDLQESIRKVLREEDYSPAGKEIIPNSIIVHKSNPMFRDKIMENGLKVRAGECYKVYVGYGVKCKPAIFATNSTNKRAWFDSTYDDDIWEINTEMIPDVKWYKDRHFESRSKHIVTFQDIPKEAITLKYKGTGSGDVETWDKDSPNLYESIKKVLKEETEGIDSFLDEISSKHNMSDELKDFVKQFIEESDCKRINFSRFKMGVMGLALESGVLINSVALNHPLPFLLFLIFHEVAHQYQFKKYGEDVMYDCYLGEISEREAAEFMKHTEEVADDFAFRKIRQLQKLNLIGPYTPPQMYKHVPIQQITMMVNNYREDMRKKNIDSPKKVSEYFYNMVKSEL